MAAQKPHALSARCVCGHTEGRHFTVGGVSCMECTCPKFRPADLMRALEDSLQKPPVPASAGSQEPAPARKFGSAECEWPGCDCPDPVDTRAACTGPKFGSVDGASPVRDDRTWTICRDVMAGRTGHWRVAQDSANAASLSEPFREAVDVRPASELARVQDKLQREAVERSRCMLGWSEADERLDQAREALNETLSWQAIRHPLPWHIDSDWTEEVIASDGYCIAKCRDRAVAESIVAAASGVTEKEDGTDGR